MWNTSSILVTGSCTAHQISILDVLLKSLIINRLVLSKFILLLRNCHGAAVGRLGRLHDYPFWTFPFLCLD